METMEQFVELSEDGRAFEDEKLTVPSVRQSLLHLLEFAEEREGLQLEGAWRLETEVARELRESAGYDPAGGWRGLASLAAGCGVLSASREEFRPAIERRTLNEWTASAASRRLLEAFTRRLVPPSTAAGLFILLRLHPAWGVHAAHRCHRRFDEGGAIEVSQSDAVPGRSELFPETVAEIVDRAVFEAVTGIVAALRRLEARHVYPIDTFSGFVDAICRRVHRRGVERSGKEPDAGLSPFVDFDRRGANWRVTDFTTSDLIDGLLVPAGVGQRFNDETFCVISDGVDDARVGPLEPDEQDELLAEILGGDSECRVA